MDSTVLPEIGPVTRHSPDQAKQRLLICAKAGVFRHAIAKQYQGFGNSFAELADIHDALGYKTRDPGLILAINAHLWGAVFTLQRFASEQQKNTWIPLLLDGSIIGGHAISEPQGGSDVQAMTTSYTQADDAFVLNGHKRYITNTPICGMLVVYAKQTNTDKISAFIVQPDDQGAQFKASPTVDGCAGATMGDVVLADCSIPRTRRLGKAAAGGMMIQMALELERAFIFSGIAGVMQWQLQQVINHVTTRGKDTKKLAQYQAVSHKIAEMKLRLDTLRLWIRHCAQLIDTGKRITVQSAQTKLYAGEAFLQSSLDTVHLLGASGLTVELTALVNDAMAGRLMSGSSEIQKNIIAAMQGVPGGTRD